MSFKDFFKIKQFKTTIQQNAETIQRPEEENQSLKETANLKLSVKQLKPVDLEIKINKKEKELSDLESAILSRKNKIQSLSNDEQEINSQINDLENQLVSIKDEINMESFGLYKPRYKFANSSAYKAKLITERANQKEMIRENKAGIVTTQMTLNNSVAKGKAMQKKNIKIMLRAFNGECEAAINKVTKSNIETIEKRILRSYEQLNKLMESNSVRISEDYLDSKINEAHIALEYALKKEEEKEQLREEREREREEKALQRELASERKKYEKDEQHFAQAEKEVQEKIDNSKDENEILSLKEQLSKLQNKLSEIQKKKEKLNNRAENPTAGYVYIISNIGSFGKNVFKIGVTRRLNPLDRINELGSASVPFKFDVHALIFSDNAYKLESELHNKFNDKRINQVNHRKEYFNITIDDIKNALKDYQNLTFDFNELPAAEEFYESQKILNSKN